MQNFLFRFGYCDPFEWESNLAHGWDDESSFAFFVSAPSQDQALAWGREVAENFVCWIFSREERTNAPSWKHENFAHWIDENPEVEFTPEQLGGLPVVPYGLLPDFSTWPK